jgi:hypothetical protein
VVVEILSGGKSRSLAPNLLAPIRQPFNDLIDDGLNLTNRAARMRRYLKAIIIGAKLAAPDKLNTSAMAIEIPHLVVSHDKYGAHDIGGRYADPGRAMGGWSERVEKPDDIAGAFARARKATESGQAALIEFITSQETRFSHRGALR